MEFISYVSYEFSGHIKHWCTQGLPLVALIRLILNNILMKVQCNRVILSWLDILQY